MEVKIDTSHLQAMMQAAFNNLCAAWERPSVLYRPRLFMDGDMYCALLGENLQEGCAGFGKTPAEAMSDFDKAWRGEEESAAPATTGEED